MAATHLTPDYRSNSLPLLIHEEKSASYYQLTKDMIINGFPMMIYLISIYIVFLTNLHFAGLQGDPNLTDAVGFSNTLFTCSVFGLVFGLNNGLLVVCAQAFGAKNHKLVGYYFHRGLVIIVIIYILCLIFLLFNRAVLTLLNLPTETQNYIHEIVIYGAPGLFFFSLFDTLKNYFIANGIYNPQFIIQTTLSFVHIVWAYIFVDYLDMKAKGIGISMTITYTLSGILLYAYAFILKPTKENWFWFTKDSFKGLWELLKTEVTIGSMSYLEWINYEIAVIFSSVYSAEEMAAQITVYNIIGIFYVAALGFSVVCNQSFGEAIGKKDIVGVKKLFHVNFAIILVLIVVEDTILAVFTRPIVSFFAPDLDVINYTVNGLYIYCLVLPLDFTQCLFAAYLRAIGQENKASVFFVLCYYFIGLPLAFLFGNVLKYYVNGLWVGLGIGIFAMCVTLTILMIKTDLNVQVTKIDERLERDKAGLSFETANLPIIEKNTDILQTDEISS